MKFSDEIERMRFSTTIKQLVNYYLMTLFGVKLSRVKPNVIKRQNRQIVRNKPHIAHSIIQPRASYSPWIDDKEFQDAYRAAKKYTMVDIYRCYELFSLIKQIKKIEGSVLEVGVWRGGSSAIIQSALKQSGISKKFYIADTFAGVVKTSDRDHEYTDGEHAVYDLKYIHDLYEKLDLPEPQILKGVFPDDHGDVIQEKIAFLHSDVDIYYSTKDIIEWVLPKLAKNAIVVFDDYGFSGCEGVTDFCNELRSSTDLTFIHNLNGHAIFINNS